MLMLERACIVVNGVATREDLREKLKVVFSVVGFSVVNDHTAACSDGPSL